MDTTKSIASCIRLSLQSSIVNISNRGYTDYAINEKKNKLASFFTPKSIGEQIGIVINTGKDFFEIASEHDLNNGDGLCFFDSENNLKGTIVNLVNKNRIYPDKINHIKKGTIIYRNHNHIFIKQIEKTACSRQISVSFTLNEFSDGYKLGVIDEDGNSAEYSIFSSK